MNGRTNKDAPIAVGDIRLIDTHLVERDETEPS